MHSLLLATRGSSTVDDLGSDEVLRTEPFPLLTAAWSSSDPVAWLAREQPALVTEPALRAAVLPVTTPLLVGWSGFDQVADDLGHEYLVTSFGTAPRNGLRTRREQVWQVCFPAVAAGASRLVLTSDGYELIEVIRTGAPDARPDLAVRSVPLRLVLDVPLAAE